MARTRFALMVAATMLVVTLSGCLDASDRFYDFDPDEHYRNPGVFPGSYQSGTGGSVALERGNLTAMDPYVVRLTSDLPAYGEASPVMDAAGFRSDVDIVMAIWRPANVTGPVPIIMDAGPYFEIGCLDRDQNGTCIDEAAIDDPQQTTPFHLANFLPRGYAVVQLAVRGTGTAGGCMDLMGPAEQHDLDQALTWLGEQEWSNGKIAMTGASYDGSTPWVAAATGNPYLKTIVPVSGLPDIYDLMFHNGSAEERGPIMHNSVYWGYGFNNDFPQRPDNWPEDVPWLPPAGTGSANGRQDYQDWQNLLCPEVVEGSAVAQYTTASGDRASAASSYWVERDHRQDVIDNYDGSIFLVHGLQDWNVDPHAAIPFNQQLRDAGFEMKEWYGQWGHSYPDSTCPGTTPDWAVMPCRLDYADILRRWYDHYLMDNDTVELGPSIQVQDNVGFWRNVDSYPPQGLDWTPLQLTADGKLAKEGGASGEVTLMPPGPDGPGEVVALVSEPLPEGLHLSGLPQLRLPFSVEGQGGHIAAWLFDQDPNGFVRAPMAGEFQLATNWTKWMPFGTPVVGHAQMNLRYHAGGEEQQPLVPGERTMAYIEFEPLEVRVQEGHRLVLWLFQYHYDDRTDSMTPSPVTLYLDEEAVFRLPAVDVDPRTVFPVPGANFLNRTYVPEMYVPMPDLPPPFAALSGLGVDAPIALDAAPAGPAMAGTRDPGSARTGPAAAASDAGGQDAGAEDCLTASIGCLP